MRLVLRVFVLTAALAIMAGDERPAFAGASPPMTERQIQHWSDWWMNEIERECLPTPQLLYVQATEKDWAGEALTAIAEQLPAPDEFEIFYPRCSARSEWSQDNADRIIAQAITMPCGIDYVRYDGPGTWVRWTRLFDESPLPAFKVKPARRNGEPFTWVKNMRAPAMFRSHAFPQGQPEGTNPLRVNYMEASLELDEGMEEFKYKPHFKWHYPFSNFDGCE